MLDICLLGNGGMLPLPDRWLTSLLLRFKGKMFLVDCGEGCQIQIARCGWGFKEIEAIFITHFHADHIAGLPGLLLTIGNHGRTEDLTIYGPPGLTEVVRGLSVIFPVLPYSYVCVELPADQSCSVELGDVLAGSLPVPHGTDCLAWSFVVPRRGRFDADRARALGIPVLFWQRLAAGESVGGFRPEDVLGPARKGLKVCYCTDARPVDELAGFAGHSDLFICEGMYADDDKSAKAMDKGHMTFSEAAGLAQKAGVRELWLTHFSPSLKDPDKNIPAVRAIFQNTHTGHALKTKTLIFEQE